MLEYISGRVQQLNPAFVIIDNQGLGYFVNISLFTHSALQDGAQAKLLLHESIREDAHVLYGFITEEERAVFRALISVSGIGANTARMMLSKLSPNEIIAGISTGNVNLLKSIKGIGAKSAERVIVDLKDKIGKDVSGSDLFPSADNTVREEALSAMVMLGFPKNVVEKLFEKLLVELKGARVEDIVKESLKRL